MPFPSAYVLPTGQASSLVIEDVENRGLQADIVRLLIEVGLQPQVNDDLIVLTEVGGVHGNKSTTIVLDLVEFDGRGTLLLQAFLGEAPPGSEINAGALAGAIASSAMFGGVQVRRPNNAPEQLWLVVPVMQAMLAQGPLMDALILLADEADFLDDLVARYWT